MPFYEDLIPVPPEKSPLEFDFTFTVENITQEQAEFLVEAVTAFVNACKGTIGGGFAILPKGNDNDRL